MLQVALALLLILPACVQTRQVPVRAVLCDALSGDMRAADDYSDLTCAKLARLRVYDHEVSTVLADRCIELGGATRLEDLFATDAKVDRTLPVSLGNVNASARVAVEVGLYPPGSASCSESPLIASGISAWVGMGDPPPSIQVPLAARRLCGDPSDGITLDVGYLEDFSTAPTPSLAIGDLYAYDGALSTSGACRGPTTRRGQLRLFGSATQVVDGTGPTSQVSGSFFFDHSGFAGCTVAHVDDGGGGQDACLASPSQHHASIWLLRPAHLQRIRDASSGLPNPSNGALVVRVVDVNGSFAGARVTFDLLDQRNEAQYVLDKDWNQIIPSGTGTTSDGSGVAVFLDAPTGRYLVNFGDGTVVTFNAGAAADTRSVTTFVVSR
jgi:hypothetical protein